jgi:hypothetical protein
LVHKRANVRKFAGSMCLLQPIDLTADKFEYTFLGHTVCLGNSLKNFELNPRFVEFAYEKMFWTVEGSELLAESFF